MSDLIFEPAPAKSRARTNHYVDMLQEFMDSGEPSARVNLEGKSIPEALRRARTNLELADSIQISTRDDKVYLIRKDLDEE